MLQGVGLVQCYICRAEVMDWGRGAALVFTLPTGYLYKIIFCKLFWCSSILSEPLEFTWEDQQTFLYPSVICWVWQKMEGLTGTAFSREVPL